MSKSLLQIYYTQIPLAIDIKAYFIVGELDRVRAIAERLALAPPAGHVFVVAGTNGKGTCCAFLSELLRSHGLRVGLYSSPHLIRYNERIQIGGENIADAMLVAAFEEIESVRGDISLTYFEFGTLAALLCFSRAQCEAWVLEIGLGGRLDAVNIAAADYSIITTVDFDHQDWLGDTIEAIATEKAGIIKSAVPAFYGDQPVPNAVVTRAAEAGAPLIALGQQYSYSDDGDTWSWRGLEVELKGLAFPPGRGAEQLRNISLGLAVIEQYSSELLASMAVREIIGSLQLAGRFQIIHRQVEWVLDVAHNVQAARALNAKLLINKQHFTATTIVIGMLADKDAALVATILEPLVSAWYCAGLPGERGQSGVQLAGRIGAVLEDGQITACHDVNEALDLAVEECGSADCVLVFGSFLTAAAAIARWVRAEENELSVISPASET